jgi:glycosyltransferase involved in cell wall biosynthesis
MKTGVFITTKDRPSALCRSLPHIVNAAREVDAEVLLIDDGSDDPNYASEGATIYGTRFLRLQLNRGLACAMNVGLSWFLADPSIEAIHYCQDDIELDRFAFAAINEVLSEVGSYCVTGHDAVEHHAKPHSPIVDAPGPEVRGIKTRVRPSCRATQMSALRAAWTRVMPIRSKGLGLPKRVSRDPNDREQRGEGSSADWWIVRDHPNALPVLCVPGLARTFAFKAEDSTWANPQIAGEDGPLHREAIKGWVEARGK